MVELSYSPMAIKSIKYKMYKIITNIQMTAKN
jgi:hypothetical protein